MSNIDDILKKLNINDVESAFGLDSKKKHLEKEIARKTQPTKYVNDAEKYFNTLVTPDSLKTLIKNISDSAGDNLSQKDLKNLINKSVKERIKYAQEATEAAYPNAKSTLNNLVYNNHMDTFLKRSTKPTRKKNN